MQFPNDILVVIPARAGSQRIKNKNLIKIKNKTLIEYSFGIIKDLKIEKQTYVTTDSLKIFNISKKYSLNCIKRPKNISKNKSKIEEALLHLLNNKKVHNYYKWILLMQPTSPLREKKTILKAIDLLKKNEKKIDTIISFTETREDFWEKRNSYYKRSNDKLPRRQQDRKLRFYENGLIYIIRIENFKKTKKIYSNRNLGIITDKIESIDINTMEDVKLLKKIIK
jgi:CMP-N,N'-diacetyllegionaminic acid synthase